MAKNKGAIVINTENCKGCKICIEVCPTEVISMSNEVNSKGYHYAYPENMEACTGCVNCAITCPDTVITVYKIRVE